MRTRLVGCLDSMAGLAAWMDCLDCPDSTRVDSTGLDWTGRDWTGLGWTGELDWRPGDGGDHATAQRRPTDRASRAGWATESGMVGR